VVPRAHALACTGGSITEVNGFEPPLALLEAVAPHKLSLQISTYRNLKGGSRDERYNGSSPYLLFFDPPQAIGHMGGGRLSVSGTRVVLGTHGTQGSEQTRPRQWP
jgi:hypothetical protein